MRGQMNLVTGICVVLCAFTSHALAEDKDGSEFDSRIMGVWNWTSSFDVDCWKGSSFGHAVIDTKLAPGMYSGVFTASMQTMQAKREDCTNPPANTVSARVVYKVLNANTVEISTDGGGVATFAWTGSTLRGNAGVRQSIGTKQ